MTLSRETQRPTFLYGHLKVTAGRSCLESYNVTPALPVPSGSLPARTKEGETFAHNIWPTSKNIKIYDLILSPWVLWQKFNWHETCTIGRLTIKEKEKTFYHLEPSWCGHTSKPQFLHVWKGKSDLPCPAQLEIGPLWRPRRQLTRKWWFWNHFVNIKTCVMRVNELTKLLPSLNKVNSFISFTVDF